MADLWFIGLGLGDERDVGPRARDILHESDRIFAEEYTAVWAVGALDRLSEEIGRPIERLGREEVESEDPVLDALAQCERVVFLAVGDPFSATTHLALRLAAARRGHRTHYLPNASILTAAAGFLGLMPYRFGRTVSIPLPDDRFRPTSFLAPIRSNWASDLHTLVLLDLRPSEGTFLTAGEAIRILRERDRERATLPRGLDVAVVARVGSDSAAGWYGPIDELSGIDFGPPMHALVVPARTLHFEEQAAIQLFRTSRDAGGTPANP
ncbi:MAG: diphthine synthase [Thermoplasmata archaeon]